ncbi:MAG: hypothetical protein JWO80_1680 [Bryobacterales bacterium]|nr:hypothetical protein [Bryobacterales bacterium]
MPTVKITDTLNAVINSVSANTNPLTSALEKYVTTPAVAIVLLPDLVNALAQPVIAAGQTPLSLGLKFSSNVDFGTTANPELTVSAGITQNVNVNAKPGAKLFPTDFYGSPITVKNGEGWLSLALNATVNLGLSGSASDLKFGFTGAGAIGTEYFRSFAVDATTPTVAEALGEVLSDFTLPADIADLNAMQTADISTVSGNGSFGISGSVSVSTSGNPLASPKLPLVHQSVSVQASASINVKASFQLSGAYQIRARKLAPNSVELGYYRKKGTQWSVSVTASAGVGAEFGKTDLLAKLIAGLTGKPEADVAQLVAGGLKDSEIKQIEDAIGASIDHSLKASLDLELSSSNTDEAAFLYRIDTAALDAQSSSAVHAALDGDLSPLTLLEENDNGQGVIASGVSMLRSSLKTVRDGKSSLKVNLVGLLNFSSMFELIQNSEVVFEPVTGDLTINETVSGTTIGVLTLPAAQEKLRKIKFNSLLVTSAYRASKSLSAMQVTSSDVYFAFNQNTNEHTMSDYLDAVAAVGLINVVGKQELMSGFHGTGPSTFLLRVEFGDPACDAMFVDAQGGPRAQLEYEAIGRAQMQGLLLPGDHNDADKYRRDILASDDIWAGLKAAGQPTFGQVLPGLANDIVRLSVLRSDYTAIMWWAESMASTAKKLADIRIFIGAADPATLQGNNTFDSLREDLQNHVAGVVANSGLQFGLPFGLAALYQAAFPLAVPNGIIVSDSLNKTFAPAIAVVAGQR